eukprot:151325-Chlamydomonas_euryale.AAC.18
MYARRPNWPYRETLRAARGFRDGGRGTHGEIADALSLAATIALRLAAQAEEVNRRGGSIETRARGRGGGPGGDARSGSWDLLGHAGPIARIVPRMHACIRARRGAWRSSSHARPVYLRSLARSPAQRCVVARLHGERLGTEHGQRKAGAAARTALSALQLVGASVSAAGQEGSRVAAALSGIPSCCVSGVRQAAVCKDGPRWPRSNLRRCRVTGGRACSSARCTDTQRQRGLRRLQKLESVGRG